MWHVVAVAVAVNYLLALLVCLSVLYRRKEPMAMLVWILVVLGVPVLGLALYFLLGSTRVRRKASRRRRRIAHLVAALRDDLKARVGAGEAEISAHLPEDLVLLERIGRRLVDIPATPGNQVDIFEDAEATYTALERAIRGAEHHVYMQYYIWQPDATGEHFRDLLVEKARAGVECRLLLDAVGCWKLTRRFLEPLHRAGVEVAFFLPLRPFRKRLSVHLRNHRKIAVVDGQEAFLGSQNIGDEYRGRLKRLSPWVDGHMRVLGPAALFLQETFAEDWSFATRRPLPDASAEVAPVTRGGSIVQILPTGPDQPVGVLGQILFGAVSSARHSIRIATPYFVPDAPLRMALAHASYRGVRVQIVLPTRSDIPITLWAGRSFYAELLEAGLELYEYDAGMLHSKTMAVDERWCMLGSANMDIRSFRLNFEVTALVYDPAVAAQLAASIDARCAAARRITLRDVWGRSWSERLREGGARLFAPLL